MTTRSGTPYQQAQVSSSVAMDQSFENLMRTMTEQFKQLNTRFDQMEERIGTLEENRLTPTEPQSPRLPPANPRVQCQEYTPDHPSRRPHHDYVDQDERALRNIHLDAPTFDGNLDPKVYIDWEGDMDQYFDWYEMSKHRKFKFAKLRMIRQARLYWGNVERMSRQRGDIPIATWRAMKRKIREKYLPMSYKQRLLDQWQ